MWGNSVELRDEIYNQQSWLPSDRLTGNCSFFLDWHQVVSEMNELCPWSHPQAVTGQMIVFILVWRICLHLEKDKRLNNCPFNMFFTYYDIKSICAHKINILYFTLLLCLILFIKTFWIVRMIQSQIFNFTLCVSAFTYIFWVVLGSDEIVHIIRLTIAKLIVELFTTQGECCHIKARLLFLIYYNSFIFSQQCISSTCKKSHWDI